MEGWKKQKLNKREKNNLISNLKKKKKTKNKQKIIIPK